MRISTEIASIANHVGEKEAIRIVAKAGFDAYDLSLFDMGRFDWDTNQMIRSNHPFQTHEYLKYVRELKKIADDHGIICNQSHAPFPIYCKEIWDLQKRAIECTAEAGGEICVIHPDNYKSAEENAQMYREILPFAKDHGVKIATENMWNWNSEKNEAAPAACSDPESFLAHLNVINDPYFVACLDIGHAEMRGLGTSAPELIQALGGHLQALHLHDNDRWHDSHTLPFTMDIDYGAVAAALKKVGYAGFLTLEADQHCAGCAPEELAGKVAEMAQASRRLSDMIEA